MLYLTEDNVKQLLTMEMALQAVEAGLRSQGLDEAVNVPRGRCQTDTAMLHVMAASSKRIGYLGYKAYITSKKGSHFHVMLYSSKTAEPVALIEADYLGQVRTGAASGVATQCMARPDATEVGIFGSGKQARTQLWAVCKARNIARVQVYSPSEERRRRFAEEMTKFLSVEVQPVDRPETAAEDKDILITATTSRDPVLLGQWIADGTHLNVIGSNFLGKTELDVAALQRCDMIVVDSKEQCRIEAGDFVKALEEGALHWSNIQELSSVLVGRHPGRARSEDVTLFKSVGIALEDVAVAAKVYEKAKAEKLGREV
jgi:ornithine cyclodeaminase/alanine dehydrogenase-like protein (mu-crystallin family)